MYRMLHVQKYNQVGEMNSIFCCCSSQGTPQVNYNKRYSATGISSTMMGSQMPNLDSFPEKLTLLNNSHRQKMREYRNREEAYHLNRNLDSLRANVAKSMRSLKNSYLKYICFNQWPNHMNQRLVKLEQCHPKDWKRMLLIQFDQFREVFQREIRLIYSQSIQNTSNVALLTSVYQQVLDKISASDEWKKPHFRIHLLLKYSPWPHIRLIDFQCQDTQFKFEIDLLNRIYLERQFSLKKKHLDCLEIAVSRYQNPRIIESVISYCICKTERVGYLEMLEIMESLWTLQQDLRSFVNVLKLIVSRLVRNQPEVRVEYIRYDLNRSPTYYLSAINQLNHIDTNWVSAFSLNHLTLGVSYTFQLLGASNAVRIGVVSKVPGTQQRRKDYSRVKQSVCLCLMSSSILQRGEKRRVDRPETQPREVTLTVLHSGVQWHYSQKTVTSCFPYQSLSLHIVMKRGQLKQLPPRVVPPCNA